MVAVKMAAVGGDLGVVVGGLGVSGNRDAGSLVAVPALREERMEGMVEESVRVVAVPSVYGRTVSSSFLDAGTTKASVVSVMQPQHGDFRSKSVAWKEPRFLMQIMRSRRDSETADDQPKRSSQTGRPSRWIRFFRKLGLDGGKKVHAAAFLNYDAQSYAMNFEKDRETLYQSNMQQMPKVSGPGARDIVTVLLRRSTSANRNCGCVLIPKPVLLVTKHEESPPLWKRRSVQAPSFLNVKMRALSFRKRRADI